MVVRKKINGVKVNIVKDYDELSTLAARLVLKKIKLKSKRNINLLVPTGTTPEGIYEILSLQPKIIFNKVTFFNFDEYCYEKKGKIKLLPATDKRSYRYFMKKNLFSKIGKVRHYFPSLKNINVEGTYDILIEEKGGIDICIDALGENGHTFGFNEPGTKFNSLTRLVKISRDTQEVNKSLNHQKIPKYALTSGISTGMKAREVILVVSGKRKAKIIRKVLYGAVSEKVPATILKMHKRCTWIIDEAAASKL